MWNNHVTIKTDFDRQILQCAHPTELPNSAGMYFEEKRLYVLPDGRAWEATIWWHESIKKTPAVIEWVNQSLAEMSQERAMK